MEPKGDTQILIRAVDDVGSAGCASRRSKRVTRRLLEVLLVDP